MLRNLHIKTAAVRFSLCVSFGRPQNTYQQFCYKTDIRFLRKITNLYKMISMLRVRFFFFIKATGPHGFLCRSMICIGPADKNLHGGKLLLCSVYAD